MYPLVELLTGLLFLGCYLAFRSTTSGATGTGFIADIVNGGFSVEIFKWAVFAALLIVLIFTDLRERLAGRGQVSRLSVWALHSAW